MFPQISFESNPVICLAIVGSLIWLGKASFVETFGWDRLEWKEPFAFHIKNTKTKTNDQGISWPKVSEKNTFIGKLFIGLPNLS